MGCKHREHPPSSCDGSRQQGLMRVNDDNLPDDGLQGLHPHEAELLRGELGAVHDCGARHHAVLVTHTCPL